MEPPNGSRPAHARHTAPTGRTTRVTARTQFEVQLYNAWADGEGGRTGLHLLHSHTRPGWLASARIQVVRSGGGTSLPAATAGAGQSPDPRGFARFTELDPGEVYDVRVTLPSFDGAFTSPVLDLVARFRREPRPGRAGGTTLVAQASPGDQGRWALRRQPDLHPRVSIVGPGTIAVDVTFVEATVRAQNLAVPRDSSLTVRVFEYTAGGPCCWLVVTPTVTPGASLGIGALVFFRPAITFHYLNTDDFSWGHVNRYFASPDGSHPWYAQPPGSPDGMKPWPDCGWYEQIQRAGKPLVFIHPVPTGAGFGAASGSALKRLLDSLYVALWDAHLFGIQPLASVQRNHLAIAGFSAGGHGMFPAFTANAHSVDELYLFDPVALESAHDRIVHWASAGGRKLRMAGYLNWDGLRGLARHVHAYVHNGLLALSLAPAERSYWTSPDELLARAIRWNDHQGAAMPADVTLRAGSRSGDVTIETARAPGSLHEEGLSLAEVELLLGALHPNWHVRGNRVVGVTFDQPSWEHGPAPPPGGPPRQFGLTYFVTSDHGLRHQWAVVGGTGDPDRGSGFTGYLQQWLRDSDFRVE